MESVSLDDVKKLQKDKYTCEYCGAEMGAREVVCAGCGRSRFEGYGENEDKENIFETPVATNYNTMSIEVRKYKRKSKLFMILFIVFTVLLSASIVFIWLIKDDEIRFKSSIISTLSSKNTTYYDENLELKENMKIIDSTLISSTGMAAAEYYEIYSLADKLYLSNYTFKLVKNEGRTILIGCCESEKMSSTDNMNAPIQNFYNLCNMCGYDIDCGILYAESLGAFVGGSEYSAVIGYVDINTGAYSIHVGTTLENAF